MAHVAVQAVQVLARGRRESLALLFVDVASAFASMARVAQVSILQSQKAPSELSHHLAASSTLSPLSERWRPRVQPSRMILAWLASPEIIR